MKLTPLLRVRHYFGAFMSWYEFDESGLNKSQKLYINVIQKIFNVRNPEKKWVPYILEPHQKQYHSESIVCKKYDAADRMIIKSRNTSFTTSTLIDLIMAANEWEDHIVPIIAQRFTDACDIIDDARKILQHVNPNDMLDANEIEMLGTEIKFPNGSVIRAYPSSSAADGVRGRRTLTMLIDEAAIQRNFKELLAAAQETSSGAIDGKVLFQMNIGTTLRGRTSYFYNFYQRAKTEEKMEFTVHEWPVINPSKLKTGTPLTEQNLQPIAWWHDLAELEKARFRDINSFMQEYMCIPLDDTNNYIPYELILSCVDKSLPNKMPDRAGYYAAGLDVATLHDLATLDIFEKTEFGWIHRLSRRYKNLALPLLQDEMENIIQKINLQRFSIDMTGIGTQLVQYLKMNYGSKIQGVHFARRVGDFSQPVKEKIAITLKTLMQDDKIRLIDEPILVNHINAVDYGLNAAATDEGHADHFWSIGLAVTDDIETIAQKKKEIIAPSYVAFAKR